MQRHVTFGIYVIMTDLTETSTARARNAADAPEISEAHVGFLGRYQWLPVLVLLIAPFAGQIPALILGISSDPIWSTSSAVIGVRHGLLGGMPFDDPNTGWTTQALGNLAAYDWLHGIIPWWNPYSGIGLPLAGEIQPAAFFLPFVLLLFFHHGIFWLERAMQIIAGLSTYALLRRLKFTRLSALSGALLYAFSGTFAWTPGEVLLNVMAFLPTLLLGIENARDRRCRRQSVLLIAAGIGFSILGGFPEEAYIDGLFALLWAGFRLFEADDRIEYVGNILCGGVIGLLIAAPQLVAFFDFLTQSDVVGLHQYGLLSLSIRGMSVILLPYVFGPLTASYGRQLIVAINGGVGGFLGATLLGFSCLGVFLCRDRRLRILLLVWLILCAGKTFGIPPIMPLMNIIPFMQDVEFFRYAAPSWEIAAIILACCVLEQEIFPRVILLRATFITLFLLAIAVYLVWPWTAFWHWNSVHRAQMVKWLIFALSIGLSGLVLGVISVAALRDEKRRWALSIILVINTICLYMLPQLSGLKPGQIDKTGIRYLRTNLGLSRFYTLGPIAPNYSAYFRISSINHNYLPLPLNWSSYVIKHLLPSVAELSGTIFWAPFPPLQIPVAANDIMLFKKSYLYLGVRYIVTDPSTNLIPTISFPSEPVNGIPLRLYAGQSVTVTEAAPRSIVRFPVIDRIGVEQGNYDNTADGILAISLCTRNGCSKTAANLNRSGDNSAFEMTLNKAIHLVPGEQFTVTVTHVSGNNPEAIWLWPTHDHGVVLSTNAGQDVTGKTIQLVFGNSSDARDFQQVYADRLMNIWRLKGADPFYTTSGSACTLQNARRDSVIATCSAHASLVRRELFMPGWRATINGMSVPVSVHHEIVQSVELRPGRNIVRFRFAPPYIVYAWIGFFLGVFALIWQGLGPTIIAIRRPHR